MQSAIIAKLERQLARGINSEADALYFLAQVRKLLEQQDAKKTYEDLTFHCDWALHAKLSGPKAQKILEQFNAAHIQLKTGIELEQLPDLLRMEIERISKMDYFERELQSFLEANSIPSLKTTRADGWTHFLHLYAQIVEDCPLVMTSENTSAMIASVTLQVDLAKAPKDAEMWFRVRWIIEDKSGGRGQMFVLIAFSLSPHGRHSKTVPIS